jgi:hypothetical protein
LRVRPSRKSPSHLSFPGVRTYATGGLANDVGATSLQGQGVGYCRDFREGPFQRQRRSRRRELSFRQPGSLAILTVLLLSAKSPAQRRAFLLCAGHDRQLGGVKSSGRAAPFGARPPATHSVLAAFGFQDPKRFCARAGERWDAGPAKPLQRDRKAEARIRLA